MGSNCFKWILNKSITLLCRNIKMGSTKHEIFNIFWFSCWDYFSYFVITRTFVTVLECIGRITRIKRPIIYITFTVRPLYFSPSFTITIKIYLRIRVKITTISLSDTRIIVLIKSIKWNIGFLSNLGNTLCSYINDSCFTLRYEKSSNHSNAYFYHESHLSLLLI